MDEAIPEEVAVIVSQDEDDFPNVGANIQALVKNLPNLFGHFLK